MRAPYVRFLALPAVTMVAACSGSNTAGSAAAPAPKVAVAAPTPKAFEYVPSASQYRFTSAAKVTQSIMGQSNDFETSAMRLVSVTIARAAADTLSLNIVLDSITIVAAMGMTPPGVEKLAGARFAAKVSPAGTVYSASGPSEAELPLAAAMTDEMGRMLPRIKGILALGASWTDTVADKPKQGGMSLDRQVISHYTVAGDSTVGGEAAWKIARDLTGTASGSGAPQGQNVVFESTSTGKGLIVISKRGVLLGGESEEVMTAKATLTANSMEIGIKTTTTTKVQKVK